MTAYDIGPGADLTRANLERADLGGADLTGAVLHGANLAGALIADATLERAGLGGVDLEGANLTDAILVQAYLRAVIAARLANMTRGGDRPSNSGNNFESANLRIRNQSQISQPHPCNTPGG